MAGSWKKKSPLRWTHIEDVMEELDDAMIEEIESRLLFRSWLGGGKHKMVDGECTQCGARAEDLARWPGATCPRALAGAEGAGATRLVDDAWDGDGDGDGDGDLSSELVSVEASPGVFIRMSRAVAKMLGYLS